MPDAMRPSTSCLGGVSPLPPRGAASPSPPAFSPWPRRPPAPRRGTSSGATSSTARPSTRPTGPSRWAAAAGATTSWSTTRAAPTPAVSGGLLTITARRESGGFNCWYGPCQYTSTRMITRGKREFTYGRIEARMSLPMGQGLWPAFWMLGTNIGSVGWPACGEIDVMEHINRETQTHGTIHWDAGGHASYGGSRPVPDPDGLPRLRDRMDAGLDQVVRGRRPVRRGEHPEQRSTARRSSTGPSSSC